MRTVMWFTAGFAAVCGICSYGLYTPWLVPAAAVLILLSIGFLCFARDPSVLPPAVTVLAGGIAGLIWFGLFYFWYLLPVNAMDGQVHSLSITATDYGYETGYGTGVDGVVSVADKPYQIRLYLSEEQTVAPGDRLEGCFRIRMTLPDAERDSTYFQGKGVFLLGYQQEEVTVTAADTIPKWCMPALLRQKILGILEELFPGDVSGFAKALLLGDSRDLDYGVNTAFRVSGIRHIIAVSGLHISMLYGIVSFLTLKRRFLTAVLGIPVLVLFSAVAGFTPSVTRACIMVALMMLAAVFDREYDAPTALAFAVLVMLICNPMAVTSVSLQMSAGCVSGILLFHAPISGWLKSGLAGKKGTGSRVCGLLCGSVSVTLSSMTLVTPLAACYFGTVSLVGILTNLLTLWVVTLAFNGLVLVCAAWFALPGLAAGLAAVLVWPIRYVLWMADALASFPPAAVYTKSIYVVFWLVFVYCLLFVFLRMQKKTPGVLLCCGVTGLCIALMASWLEPLSADTRITMLDVGQGQSILLQSEGKTFLVDCGGDDDGETADIIAETLLSEGISRLDGIIVTHYDRDHAGALENLLSRIGTDYLFLPDTRNDITLPQIQGEILYVWEDLLLSFGSAQLQIYGPVYSGLDNENSLCVLFDTEKCDILITGDRSEFGERMLLRRKELQDVDILVAGHHGAKNSTSEALLMAVKPETVLISTARDNIYGHPAPELLQRLADYGCAVYRTDQHGTITIRR